MAQQPQRLQHQYVHYTGPPGVHLQQQQLINGNAGISPLDTTHQPQQQQQQQPQQQQPQNPAPTPSTSAPLVATGDWTKDLVHLAKTAELKKHALTLQLHTAHILSAHASLQEKSKTIQDIREQKNKLESERTRLLNALREINEDRDKTDLMESSIDKECNELRAKITQLTDGEYASAKSNVDRLRQELGQPPLPNLQTTLDEKASQYLNERRLNGNEAQNTSASTSGSTKRGSEGMSHTESPSSANKRPRGRPRGSKNRKSGSMSVVAGENGSTMGVM